MANKENVKELQRILDQYGRLSEEFYNQVYGFIAYLVKRFLGRFDEELAAASYARLIEALEYFDRDKANIGSFVFTVVRNQVSSFLYNKKRRQYESEDALPFIESEETPANIPVEKVDAVLKTLYSFKRVGINVDNPELLANTLSFAIDENVDGREGTVSEGVLLKVTLWHSLRLQLN